MKKKTANCRQLVIDANIARSAGGPNAVHPTSQHCRDILKLILELAHSAAMSPPLLSEWKKHRSVFAKIWLVSMIARRQLVKTPPQEHKKLRSAITQLTSLTDKDREAIEKDLHLVETAVASDRIILSLDDTMRTLIRSIASTKVKDLRTISWANPDTDHDSTKDWLSGGCYSIKYHLINS